ncbi:MAG: hypothetical protein WDO18_04285 [Acidobacteriota bacterium]
MKLLAVIFAIAAWAQSGIDTPSIGVMRDARGAWHAVYGVPGSFVLGSEVEAPEAYSDAVEAAVSAIGDELVLQRADASELRFRLAGVRGMRAMSRDYIQVSAEGGEYVLRTTLGREGLFLLPALPEVAEQ